MLFRSGGECRHNLGYWRSDEWLGIGPGAHAYLNGTRSWNLKHPAAWAAQVDAGQSGTADSEVLDPEGQRREHIMLRLRLREGLPTHYLSPAGLVEAQAAVTEGLLTCSGDAFVLTDAGRLLADGLVARLWD